MKMTYILLASAALLAIAVVAEGFPLNITALFSIGCAAGIVALFAHDYRRVRRRFQLRSHRAPVARPQLRLTAGSQPVVRRSALIERASTVGGQRTCCP